MKRDSDIKTVPMTMIQALRSAMDVMLERYGKDLTFEYYTQEARYVIGYEHAERDVDAILQEFDLEPIEDYFARSRRVREEKIGC